MKIELSNTSILSAKATIIFLKKGHKQVYKNFQKKRKRINAIKRGETRGQIDDIIHNSSYRQSDSAFF